MGLVTKTTLIQNSTKRFFLKVVDPTTGDLLDLTSATGLTLTMRNADQSLLALTVGAGLTLLATPEVKVQVDLTPTQTNLLNPDPVNLQPMKLAFTLMAKPYIILYENSLDVRPDPLAM